MQERAEGQSRPTLPVKAAANAVQSVDEREAAVAVTLVLPLDVVRFFEKRVAEAGGAYESLEEAMQEVLAREETQSRML